MLKNIKSLLENEYKIKINYTFKNKSYYICVTNKEKFIFRETYSNSKELYFKNRVKEHLMSNGFVNFEKIVLTKDNNPCVRIGHKSYILTTYCDYNKLIFENKEELEVVIKNIGVLHNNLKNVKLNGFIKYGISNPLKNIDDDIKLLNSIHKIIKKKKSYSDFDIEFLKNFDKNIKIMLECKKDFQRLEINRIISNNVINNNLCHGMLKENYILVNKEEVIFENFSKCSLQPQIYDVSYFIKRYIKNLPKDYIKINDFINMYININPSMEQNEFMLLKSLIKYPEDFIKLSVKYYEKNRSWTPNKFTNKLEKLRINNEIYENYLIDL